MTDKKLSEALRDLSRVDLPPDEVLRRHDAVVHAAARLEAEVEKCLRHIQMVTEEEWDSWRKNLTALRERVGG